MSAEKFIMNMHKDAGGKTLLGAMTVFGSVLMATNWLKRLEHLVIPLPVLGGLKAATVAHWVEGKAGKNILGRSAGKLAQFAEVPGAVAAIPMSAIISTGEGSVAHTLAEKKIVQKALGDNAEERLNGAANTLSGFAKTLSTTLGGWLAIAGRQLNFAGRLEAKIEAKDAQRQAMLQDGRLVLPENKAGIKGAVGLGPKTLADDAAIAKSLKLAAKRLDAAANRQRLWEALPHEAQQSRMHAADAVREKYAAQMAEVGKIKDVAARQAAYDKIDFTREDKATLKAAGPQRGLAETEARILGKLKQDVGDAHVSNKVTNAVSMYAQKHGEAAALETKKGFWNDPAKGVSNKIKNMSASDVLDVTLRYGYVAMDGISSAHTMKSEMSMLKLLVADVKGQDPHKVSMWEALFAKNDSPVVKQARSAYVRSFFGSLLPFAIGAVGQEVVATAAARRFGNRSPVVSLAVGPAMGLLHQFSGMLKASANEVQADGANDIHSMRRLTSYQVYTQYRLAQEQGEKMSATDYADLLTTLSPEMRKNGGLSSLNNKYVAQYFWANQTSVQDVMKELSQGPKRLTELAQLGEAKVAEITASMQQHQAPVHEPAAETKFSEQARNQRRSHGGSYASMVNSPAPSGVGRSH